MIRVETSGGQCRITLDRPDKANALTGEMLEALCDAVAAAENASVLVLTGTGRVFSAGADLDAARAGLATSPLWERLSGAIAAFPGMSIAALNGTVAGGAMGMVLACDMRIAVPGAKVFYPVMKLGFLPQPSDPARLSALVGPSRAKAILMGGLKIEAEQALTWGLFDMVADDVQAAVDAVAADALAASPDHVRGIKVLFPPLPTAQA